MTPALVRVPTQRPAVQSFTSVVGQAENFSPFPRILIGIYIESTFLIQCGHIRVLIICGISDSRTRETSQLCRLPNTVRVIKSRKLRWAGHVPRMVEGRSAFKILTGKTTGMTPLGRPRWEDYIKMDLMEQVSIRGIGLIGSGYGLLESLCYCVNAFSFYGIII